MKGSTCRTCLFKRISGDQRPLLIAHKFKWVNCKGWKQWNEVKVAFLSGLKLIKCWSSEEKKALFFFVHRTQKRPSIPRRHRQKRCAAYIVSYIRWMPPLCIIFPFFPHQRHSAQYIGPCSAVFLFLAVHGQTCSVIGFKFLHHKWLELGFLQPCQISTDFHQQGIVYLL